jgi:general secretion pathway protein H
MMIKNRQAGFTLIEILVVLLIISIVSSIVLITISRPSYQNVRTFQEEFIQTFSLAREESMLLPAVFMLQITDQQWQFFRYTDDNWIPVNTRILGKKKLPDGVRVKVDISKPNQTTEEEEATIPRIIFSSNGDVTAFKMYVGRQGEKPQYVIINDGSGNLISQGLSE